MIFYTVKELYEKKEIDEDFLNAFHSLNRTAQQRILLKNPFLKDYADPEHLRFDIDDQDDYDKPGS